MCNCAICGEQINSGLLMVAGEPCHKDCHTELMEQVYEPHVDPLEDYYDDEDCDERFNNEPVDNFYPSYGMIGQFDE